MEILVENHQDLLDINTKSVPGVVKSVLSNENVSCDEIMIYFVNNRTICDLHKIHFNDPSPTDCISVQVDPIGSKPCFLGEIYISTKAALDYCREDEDSVYEELTLYLVHGLLHLIGYDDLDPEKETQMRLAEKRNMDYLIVEKMIISN